MRAQPVDLNNAESNSFAQAKVDASTQQQGKAASGASI
jgi:hypothetical protein